MKRYCLISVLAAFAAVLFFYPRFSNAQSGGFEFDTDDFMIQLNARGLFTSLYDKIGKKEYLSQSVQSPLLQIRIGNEYYLPQSLEYLRTDRVLKISYKQNVLITLKIGQKKTHLVFEITDVQPAGMVDYIVWGPVATTISKTIGEIIGVVRDGNFAVGIQGLNVKTLGGYPYNDEGFDMSRGRAAEKMEFGSVIQAYSIDRSRPRNISVWLNQWANMPVEPIPGETVADSKIALFGCRADKALDRIGEIEIAEGLPHPVVDGVWIKESPEATRSYFIADYSEENIDELLDYTKRGNFRALYHMEPWVSWGHFELRKDLFPNGADGLKACAEKAGKMNIRLGAHTLTNFINTNDPYVTPVPDKRLVKTGFSTLANDIDKEATEIPVASIEYFSNQNANWLHTVVIDNELIRYRTVTDTPPYKLLDCERGAFETTPSGHKKNSSVGKLADHPYKIFFPNTDLQREIAKNLAKRFVETGLSQMDFDGHEGGGAAGQGDYGVELFAKDFYDNLGDNVVLNGTSNSEHFYWHINTYCNWGEPWYEGFREQMQEYRIRNQELFDRNLMQHMLGWYLLTETTSISDIEWMLARGAYYNAGFALATNLKALRTNPETGIILDAIREWEEARLSKSFSDSIREKMKDPKTEFHLERTVDGWNLFPMHGSREFVHEKNIRQPGEPAASAWNYENRDKEQSLQFKLHVAGENGSIRNPRFEIDNYTTVSFPVELTAGQTLLYEGSKTVRIYDAKGRQIKSVIIEKPVPGIKKGNHKINFDCEFLGETAPKVIVNFKTIGEAEKIVKAK